MIVTSGTPATLAAKSATATIPIVFTTGGDPIALGLVASLNRPGANVTGIANLVYDVVPKRLQLLRELIPNAARFGVLTNPAEFTSTIADLQAAAHTLGLQLIVVNARTDSDLEPAFAAFSQQHVGAVVVESRACNGSGKRWPSTIRHRPIGRPERTATGGWCLRRQSDRVRHRAE